MKRREFIILSAILGGVIVVAVVAWFALESTVESALGSGKETLAKRHAALCTAHARTSIHHTVRNVRGFVLRYPNFRENRTVRTRAGRSYTKRFSMSSRPCPGRCLVALLRGGYDFVENEEYAEGGGGLVGYRYFLKPRGHPECIATPNQPGIDLETRAAVTALEREGRRCLARVPAINLSAAYELSRSFHLERAGLSGAIVRVDTQVTRRREGTVLAEQTTYIAVSTVAMLKGNGVPTGCTAARGGPAHLLRPSDVLIGTNRPVREDAERQGREDAEPR